jgi:hypothetical protein
MGFVAVRQFWKAIAAQQRQHGFVAVIRGHVQRRRAFVGLYHMEKLFVHGKGSDRN